MGCKGLAVYIDAIAVYGFLVLLGVLLLVGLYQEL
jgi:hypothetical protein